MTHRCFVAGFPIQHSRSPMIHNFWIAQRGLDASYERLEVRPEDLPALLAQVRDGTFRGGNLTIPLKEVVVPLLDELTDDARAMGAVNTVFMRNGALTGANTDVPGFFAHLDLSCPGWDNQPASVLLLGAGGASRAILHGLLSRNVRDIRVSNRSQPRAAALVDQVVRGDSRPSSVKILPWPVDADALAGSDLVINATSLGMNGQPGLDLIWPASLPGTIAYDIVYVPLMTPFLKDAAKRGGRTVDGLGMLLHQAALAFGCWFGTIPAVAPELRKLVEADLLPRSAGQT